ncbi:Uncharacterised protein [Escherichia coli]|nr:Uncharacterised protein [Escherichia coli]
MRPSIIFATAEYVKRLREECLREKNPCTAIPASDARNWHRMRLTRTSWRWAVISPRCSEQKRVRIPAMKVSEWGHLLRALEIERVCH